MLKLTRMVDALDHALLSMLNEKGCSAADASGKLFMDLNKRRTQDGICYLAWSYMAGQEGFGSTHLVVESCLPDDNWRAVEGLVKPGQGRYKVLDNSVNLDLQVMPCLVDKIMAKAKKESGMIPVRLQTLDVVDFKTLLEKEFRFCVHDVRRKGVVLADVNMAWPHGEVGGQEQRLEAEMVLMQHGLY